MDLCPVCKGKKLCGLPVCPVTERFFKGMQQVPRSGYRGSAPSVFVGSRNYPRVVSGPLLTQDQEKPPLWVSKGLSIHDIVSIRAGTIRGMDAPAAANPVLADIALAPRPVEVEATFSRPVSFELKFDGIIAPIGLSGRVRHLEVLDHPPVNRAVDRMTSDTDAGAQEAVAGLLRQGVDIYQTTDLLSAGLLGRKRHLVPTRWAITAVDDMGGRHLKNVIRAYPSVDDCQVFGYTLLKNRFGILLLPGDWQFEMVERWEARSLWAGSADSVTVDSEKQKKHGYSPIAGAYYSARLAVLEYLAQQQRSARVIVVRSVGQEYWAPLGTWVIREAVRNAMGCRVFRTDDPALAVSTMDQVSGFTGWSIHSRLLETSRTQARLSDFFR